MLPVNGNYNAYDYCLTKQFKKAVKEHKEATLRGLNAFCDDAKAERIAEFKAKHKPVDGTPEEMRAFLEKLAQYVQSLERIQDRQRSESLINVGGISDDDCDVTPPVIKMYQKMIMVE